MSLDRTDVIDAVGTRKDTMDIILYIIDSWDWKNEGEHLLKLQEKLNSYFEFIERGQIYEDYPSAAGKRIGIDVMSRFPLPAAGVALLAKADVVARQLNVSVTQWKDTG